MKTLLVLGAFLGLFGTSNAFASKVENLPVEQTEVVLAADHVDYWVTNVHTEYESGRYYLYFTVNWEYTGDKTSPHIAFYITIDELSNYGLTDSAIGIRVGSRDYKTEVVSSGYYHVRVVGSDGGYTR